MTRLIDIDSDEYCLYLYYPYNYEVGDYENFMVITDYDVQSLPTVDAIPIEWIENFIDDIGDLEEEMTMRAVYSLLINEWRKENERKEE